MLMPKRLIGPGDCPIDVIGESRASMQRGLAQIERSLAPVGAAKLVRMFGELELVSAHEREKAEDSQARIEVMARRLARYPEDLVRRELWNYRSVFFPKLDEIRIPIEQSAEYRKRHILRRAFKEALDRLERGVTRREPISDAERAKVSEGFQRLRRELCRG